MSDFTSGFWAIFIVVVTVLGILGVFWFLTAQSSHRIVKKPSGQADDTGHVWDGDLRELNNPMPRWWLGMFYIGIIFGGIYLVLYPGLGTFEGLLHTTTLKEYETERTQADALSKTIYAEYTKQDIPHLATDLKAKEIGQRLFLNYCSQCHGSDAGGAKGFPNLSDNDWLYGGEPETINKTITKGRNGIMPPFGETLDEETRKDVAHYVRSLSGLVADSTRVSRGQKTFSTICAACHGANGKGNKMLGAPNLTDTVWLYGSSEKTIMETITRGRNNKMPAHEDKLTPEKIQLLTAYIWGLSKSSNDSAKH